MTLPTYDDDVDDLLQAYNWTNLPDNDTNDGLSYPRSVNGSGNYAITYHFITNQADVLATNSYQNTDNEYNNYYALQAGIISSLEKVFQVNGHNDTYGVFFTQVAKVTFSAGASASTSDIIVGENTNTSWIGSGGTGIGASTYPLNGGANNEDFYGDVWFNQGWQYGWNTGAPTSRQFWAAMHEIGHAMGLKEAAGLDTDNQKYSIMSYIGLDGMVHNNATTGLEETDSIHPEGLQLYDIAALQSVYGANYGGDRGYGGAYVDTTYKEGQGFAASASTPFIYTIWDGAGVDIIDASAYSSHHVLIDLRQGHFSSIGSAVVSSYKGDDVTDFAYENGQAKDNVAIAFYTVIENAIGTGGADLLIGNEWDNILYGGGGEDKIYQDGATYDGTDSFHASDANRPGPDASTDLSGDDILIGGADDDHLYGGLGEDILHGGYVRGDIESERSGWDAASQFPSSSYDLTYSGDGNDTADYSIYGTLAQHEDMFIWYGSGYADGVATVTKGWVDGARYFGQADTLFSIENVIGTAHEDVFVVSRTMSTTSPLVLDGGDGSDWYIAYASSAGGVIQVEDSGGTFDVAGFGESASELTDYFLSGHITTIDDVDYFDLDVSSLLTLPLTLRFDEDAITNGTGIERFYLGGAGISALTVMNYLLSNPGTHDFLDARSDMFTGGSGGTGGAGGTIPEFDGSGNVTSQRVESSIGGSAISSAIASVIDHPFVVTSFSENVGGGGLYNSTASLQTYEKAFEFLPDITIDEVRLTASGTQGNAALTIHVDSESYSLTVSDFETGKTINGISVYDQDLHIAIQDASSATLTSSATNTYSGSYTTTNGLGVDPNGSVSVTYYLEQLNFFFGSSIDLTAPITFTGSSSGETLTGLDDRADTIYGMEGNDTISGYGGNDTLIGGAGNDTVNGGLGNDTYVFASGWGSDTINESLSSGTDVIHFTDIDPSDIRIYTDSGTGKLHLTSISDPTNTIAVPAGFTGNNMYESTVGLYVESVTFDDANNTVWDLTGALTITGTSGNESLFGTAYNDTIYGLAGTDTVYGNAGNDTITGGSGTDTLNGGPGNDTYVFASGWGSDTINESLSSGTDTVHFTGIDPSDIRIYTDSGTGKLHLTSISDPTNTIAVPAGFTGNNMYESTIGLYLESVTFDDANNTVWDLTGALTITGSSVTDFLYGTAYNDTVSGLAGNDTIYGNAGNDTITGGSGTDTLNGGPGNDTYVFASGWGSDTINESLSSGTDTVHFTGIDPSDIRMYTDPSNGKLHLTSISDPTNTIAITAGVTGNNTYESTVGLYVESVTFDDVNNTVWDLTGALTFTGTSSVDNLYGTAYSDTIYGLAGNDTIYGNAGNDTITGGSGTDTLNGGPGNDTYVFASGWGSDTINESLSSGADTIHFIGIDPSDIRIYTDASNGKLHLTSISDPTNTIAVTAGVTGNNTYESTAGQYVESVTFDDANNTVWDLTGGLTITGTSSGQTLYGTAYNDTIDGMGGVDTLYGNAGDDTIFGGSANDTLRGGPGNDILQGNGGTDALYGEAGADTFMFKAATALSASDNIQDFNTGAGDKIYISDVISGYDPLNDAITDWVQITTSGSNSLLKVDTDGAANGTSWTQIATIVGVTGLTDEAALVASGNLVVHA